MNTDNDLTKKDGSAETQILDEERQTSCAKRGRAKWADIIAAAEKSSGGDEDGRRTDFGEEECVHDEVNKKNTNMLLWVLLFVAALLVAYVVALYYNVVPRLTEIV